MVINPTNNTNQQLSLIDFGLSNIGDFKRVKGYTPGYLNTSKYFLTGFDTREKRIIAELKCVAIIIQHIISLINVDLEELGDLLKNRQESYDGVIFKKMYLCFLREDDSLK